MSVGQWEEVNVYRVTWGQLVHRQPSTVFPWCKAFNMSSYTFAEWERAIIAAANSMCQSASADMSLLKCHFLFSTTSFRLSLTNFSLYPSHSLQRWLIFSQRLRVSKKNLKKNNNAELKWTPSLLLFFVLHPLPRSFSLSVNPNHRAGEHFQNNSWIEVIQGRVGVESDKDKWVNREYIMDRHSLTLHIFNMQMNMRWTLLQQVIYTAGSILFSLPLGSVQFFNSFERSLLWLPRLHLFDQKTAKTVILGNIITRTTPWRLPSAVPSWVYFWLYSHLTNDKPWFTAKLRQPRQTRHETVFTRTRQDL